MLKFLNDLMPILHKKKLIFVNSRLEKDNLYTFFFKPEKKPNWKAGQHGIFVIQRKDKSRAIRPFSLSSAPEEETISITTRISDTPSEFKQGLMELTAGDVITMRGPVGPLHIEDASPSLLIAGGIGITPFRSMLKHLSFQQTSAPVRLLYIDTDETFLFKQDLDKLRNDPNTDIVYLTSRDALYKEIQVFNQDYDNKGTYYIGGSRAMIKSITSFLNKNGVKKKRIRKDPFYGLK